MKTKIISFQNQKGGGGKTTTCVNFAIQLSKTKKVLVLDLDQQGNTTKSISGHDITEEDFFQNKISTKIFYEDLTGKIDIKSLITKYGDIFLIASNRKLTDVSNYINQKEDKGYFILYNKLKELKEQEIFDYIFIDTNPAVDNIFMNCIYACDELITPIRPEQYDFDGVVAVLEIVNKANKNCQLLEIEPKKLSVLFNSVNKRAKFHQDNLNDIRQYFEDKNIYVYNNFIRNNIKIAQSQGDNLSVEEFEKNANGTKDFKAVINEFLEKENK